MTASAQRAAEPSMEEILASIRRIIADDKSRAKFGSAKLVSVSEAGPDETLSGVTVLEKLPGEKLLGGASAPDAEPAGAEMGQVPAGARSSGESGQVAPDAPAPFAKSHAAEDDEQGLLLESEVARLFESEPSTPVAGVAPHPDEEQPSERQASSTPVPFGPTTDQLRSLPHEPPAEPLDASGEARTEHEARGAPGLTNDLARVAQATLTETESDEAWTSQEPVSRAAPSRRQMVQPIPEKRGGPELGAPSSRAAPSFAGQSETDPAGQPRLEPGPREPDAMLSSETDMAVTRAFGDLNRTVLSDKARTLEDLVREMLRPLLKSWLDDNLPQIVERLVRMEIERVARGRPQ
jgi:cell pole-organizing protein PopZ